MVTRALLVFSILTAAFGADRLGAQSAERLLANGGGDADGAVRLGKSKDKAYFDVPDWTPDVGAWFAQTEGWFDVPAIAGTRFLRVGESRRAALVQEFPLAGMDSAARPRFLVASGWLRTWRGRDEAELRIAVLDELDDVLVDATTGPVKSKSWAFRHIVVDVPRDAHHVRVSLVGVRKDGKYLDAYFDEVRVDAIGAGNRDVVDASGGDALGKPPADAYFVRTAALASATDKASFGRLRAAWQQAKGDVRSHLLTMLLLSPFRDASKLHRDVLRDGKGSDRATATRLLPHARFDVSKELARIAEKGEDLKQRLDALRRLAADGSRASLAQLRGLYTSGDDAMKLAVVKVIGRSVFDKNQVYRTFLAPHLDRDEEAALRNAALEQLSLLGDPRFFNHFRVLFRAAKSLTVRGAMIRWCARFDSVKAVDAIVELVEDGESRAGGALLAELPKLKGRDVAAWARRSGVKHRLSLVRQAALRNIAANAREADIDLLLRLSEDPDTAVALDAVAAIGRVPGTDASDTLRELLVGDDGRVAATALRALWTHGDGSEETYELCVESAADAPAFEVRVAALEVLGQHAAARSRDVFLAAFEDRERQVRTAAYFGLAKIREKASVTALLAQLDDESGTTLHFLFDALVELTGHDAGSLPGDWTRWWGIVAADFKVPAKAVPPSAKKRSASRGRTATAYYGIPVRSDNIVFIIDLSGSMNAKAKGASRIASAKRELNGILRKLDKNKRFNIVTFSNEPEPYNQKLLRATPENIEQACKWVDRLRVGGYTNIHDSLRLALDMPDVEAIFMLTDGGPTAGIFVGRGEIRESIRGVNRERKVRVHMIAIGGSKTDRTFMRALAEENFGEMSDQVAGDK